MATSCIRHAGIVQKGDELPCPVDADGRLTEPVTDFLGEYVKDADRAIIAKLKGEGRIVNVATEHHSYPFCWRSDTPLIYKVTVRAIMLWNLAEYAMVIILHKR